MGLPAALLLGPGASIRGRKRSISAVSHVNLVPGNTGFWFAGGKKGFCGNVLTPQEGEEWQLTCLLPKPISSPAARIIHDRLYVAGGWDGRMDEDKTWLSSPEVWTTEVPVSG